MPADVTRFYWSFGLTLAVVLVTALLGRFGRRRPHVVSALFAGCSLGYTVYLAEMLGRGLVIPRGILIIHLVFANSAALSFILVVLSGSRLFRLEQAMRRTWHRRAVMMFLVLVVLAAGTGTYMISQAAAR